MNINIPDEYKVNSKIPIKEFIPKFLKPEQKRRIRNSIRSVIITHQIAGQKIQALLMKTIDARLYSFLILK